MIARRMQTQMGFTLIEVMLSVAITVMITTMVWGSFSLTSRARKKADRLSARYHQLRLAMNRMAREISMAYLSKHDQVGALVPRTLFESKRQARVDELTFSAVAHVRLQENAKESDQAMIRYFAAPDPENRRQTNLMRREAVRLGSDRPGEIGPAYTMLEDIESLRFEFFDPVANEWKDSWNTRSVDGQPDRLPNRVKILLEAKDEQGKTLRLQTQTKVYLQDALWLVPQ